MTDLVTRLRALADTPHPTPQIQRILRESADALEAEETRRTMLNISNGEWSKRFHALEQERDDLKAKLAEAGALRANAETGWTDTLDHLRKAEAEAAAMREAATDLLKYIKGVQGGDWSDSEKALSQPGPGAAMLERVKKLEAVAEAAKTFLCARECDRDAFEEGLSDSLEALDAK